MPVVPGEERHLQTEPGHNDESGHSQVTVPKRCHHLLDPKRGMTGLSLEGPRIAHGADVTDHDIQRCQSPDAFDERKAVLRGVGSFEQTYAHKLHDNMTRLRTTRIARLETDNDLADKEIA